MTRYGTKFGRIDAVTREDRPADEHVGITIEIMGEKLNPQIAVWIAEELEGDIRRDANLRAGIVDALQDFLNRIAGVQ